MKDITMPTCEDDNMPPSCRPTDTHDAASRNKETWGCSPGISGLGLGLGLDLGLDAPTKSNGTYLDLGGTHDE